MAEEQLELMKSLAKAKEERHYEQMNNKELVSTPSIMKDADITSLSTPGSVVKMTTGTMATSSCISNPISVLEPESLPVHSSGNYVSGYQTSSQANSPSGYTIRQTAPTYTSPRAASRSENVAFDFETYVDIASPECVANSTGNPTSAHT